MPLKVFLGKKTPKGYILNLNNYRNWHHQISNKIKKKYCELAFEQLAGVKLQTPIAIEYRLYKSSARRIDTANVCSIHDKFFCDALSTYGCIPDDNDQYINVIQYQSMGIDKANPRMEILIHENYAPQSSKTKASNPKKHST